jgi:hypothetical protein
MVGVETGSDLAESREEFTDGLRSEGVDRGGLEEVTTWSRETEVLVSLLEVMTRIC